MGPNVPFTRMGTWKGKVIHPMSKTRLWTLLFLEIFERDGCKFKIFPHLTVIMRIASHSTGRQGAFLALILLDKRRGLYIIGKIEDLFVIVMKPEDLFIKNLKYLVNISKQAAN